MRSLLFQSREGLSAPAGAAVGAAAPRRLRRVDPRLFLPRTMSGLVAAGCVLAAAPLLLALVLAASRLDRLSHHSELLVREGVSCTPDGTPSLYVRRRIDGSSARFVLHFRER